MKIKSILQKQPYDEKSRNNTKIITILREESHNIARKSCNSMKIKSQYYENKAIK